MLTASNKHNERCPRSFLPGQKWFSIVGKSVRVGHVFIIATSSPISGEYSSATVLRLERPVTRTGSRFSTTLPGKGSWSSMLVRQLCLTMPDHRWHLSVRPREHLESETLSLLRSIG